MRRRARPPGSGGRRGSRLPPRSAPAPARSAGPGRRVRRQRGRRCRRRDQAPATEPPSPARGAAARRRPPRASRAATVRAERLGVAAGSRELIGDPLRAVRQADPRAQQQPALAAGDRMRAERRVAVGLQAARERPLGEQAGVRGGVGDRLRGRGAPPRRLPRPSSASVPWPGAGTNAVRVEHAADLALAAAGARGPRGRARSQRRPRFRNGELRQARVDVAAQSRPRRGPRAAPAAARRAGCCSCRPERPRAAPRGCSRRRARPPRGPARDCRAARGRRPARRARPWRSARRGRSGPPAAPAPARRPSATCRSRARRGRRRS